MPQISKYIDLTRSYVPVNPNTFPQSMHGTDKEDAPEQRVPVVPYVGWNFLPTSYGYRSYFGTNVKVDIDSLSPNEPDHVFMFQTLTYKNILIALCDTGIWAKDSSVTGEWTQLAELDIPAEDVYYEWWFTTIKNKLYCFRANGEEYFVIETDIAEPLDILCTPVTPTFITLTAQLGMSKFGARLCFWDANNAISWSSPDDVSDFTPNVLTGANVTTFNSVLGRISSIRPHGRHVVVYATKSIVLLQVEPLETFLVKAVPLLGNIGVPYAKMVAEGYPDTIHFAWTTAGIYRIDSGKPEVIIPEFWDYFKDITTTPVYLKVLEGRYLCFETMSDSAITGEVQFSETAIPAVDLTFLGNNVSLDDLWESDPDDFNFENSLAQLENALFNEQQEDADLIIDPSLRYPGTVPQPVYTCWLSQHFAKNDEVTFQKPFGVTGPTKDIKLSPVVPRNLLSDMTTNTTNKWQSEAPDAWLDGKWTISRFCAVQKSIWDAEAAIAEAYVNKIANEADIDITAGFDTVCGAVDIDDSQEIGEFVTQWSAPVFGFNRCSFWLTRYATETKVIEGTTNYSITCNATEQLSQWRWQAPPVQGDPGPGPAPYHSEYIFSSAQAACDYLNANYNFSTYAGYGLPLIVGDLVANSAGGNAIRYKMTFTGGTEPTGGESEFQRTATAGYTKTISATGSNEVIETNTGILGVETAFCKLTHWRYTNLEGEEVLVEATECTTTPTRWPGSTHDREELPETLPEETLPEPIYEDPFNFTVDGYEVAWDDESVTYPEIDFLTQDGSIAPRYPTLYGFFAYDLHLKKWGKHRGEYKQLLDYSPINSSAGPTIPYTTFGIVAAAVKEDGFIYLFDTNPSDSVLTYGKYGFYRKGFTHIHEISIDFKNRCTGSFKVDGSVDGKALATEFTMTQAYANVNSLKVYPTFSAKWYNFTFSGIFDITYLEPVGQIMGKR